MMTTQKVDVSKKQIWPVMLTPFTESGEVDFNALGALIEWYEEAGVDGLFALCQSSEMFFLTLKERVDVASFIVKRAHVPVIASGHISDAYEDQVDELRRITDTGVSALILLTNRFGGLEMPSAVWIDQLEKLMGQLDSTIPLGLYECPYPYKRLLSEEEFRFLAANERFHFLKDTCCDIETIKARLNILRGSRLALYNANVPTLLESLQAGAAGFSGVMANFHPRLYTWLAKHWQDQPEKARELQHILTLCSLCESYGYPINAKYELARQGLPMTTYTRSRDRAEFMPFMADIVRQMEEVVARVEAELRESR